MDRVVAALGAADRVGASGIARLGAWRVVATLAVGPADRVDRREIEHVEAHRADRRQPRDDVVECPVTAGISRLRPREQLVPAGKSRSTTLGVDREFDRMRCACGRMRAAAISSAVARREQQATTFRRVRLLELFGQRGEARCGDGVRLRGALLDQQAALFQLQIDRQTRRMLLFEFLGKVPEAILPGEDREQMPTEPARAGSGRPSGRCRTACIGTSRHPIFVRRSPEQRRGKPIMTVRDQVGGDLDHFADQSFCREAPVIDRRHDRLDHDAGHGRRLERRRARSGRSAPS